MRWFKSQFFSCNILKRLDFLFSIFKHQDSIGITQNFLKKTARLAFSQVNIYYKCQILKRTLEVHKTMKYNFENEILHKCFATYQ